MSLEDWVVEGPLSSRLTHLQRVHSLSGGKAVLKRVKKRDQKSKKARSRFANEARETYALRGHSGVIRVLDVDPAPEPEWYVSELAKPLAVELGNAPNLWNVISAVASIGETLADLADRQIFHRDVKPDNLLFARGRPVVADFGIAAWPRVLRVTAAHEKVGPAYFLAPEMRYGARDAKPCPADVYALAKTLFVLALPDRGPYPPGGAHYADAEEFSLYRAGQRTGHEVEALLEAATNDWPSFRPSMRQFVDELKDWLRTTDAAKAVRAAHPGIRQGWGPEHYAETVRINRRARNLTTRLSAAGDALATALGRSRDELGWRLGDWELLRQSYPDIGPPDEGADALSCFVSKYQTGGHRAVIAGAVWQSGVTYFAEVQRKRRGTSALVDWALDPLAVAELELPSGSARLKEVVEQVAVAM